MPDVSILPLVRPPEATARIPGSKSLTNRALIAAALARGTSQLKGVLQAEDTEVMMAALRSLGIHVDHDESGDLARVTGCGGHLPAYEADLFCGNSGTTIRFAAALCALGQGRYRLDGVDRMRQRPIGPLADALAALGAHVEYEHHPGFPPLQIAARGLRGGTVTFDSAPSSQLISGLLMTAPCAQSDVFINVEGVMVSQPYVNMTLAVMQSFGTTVVEENLRRFIVAAPQTYQARDYTIEPDASNASYFFGAAAITGGQVTVEGLGTDSQQGDAHFVDVLEDMGCHVDRQPRQLTVTGPVGGQRLRGLDIDLNDMPDMAQTLAVVALFALGPTRIRNVANLRIKETDRLTALATELNRLGAEVELFDDGLIVHSPKHVCPSRIETYDDHRMAMSFALAGLLVDGIIIKDAECVGKTFPDFFDRLDLLRNDASKAD